MIKKLSQLKYWQLAVLGLVASALAVLAVSALLRAAVAAWPQAGEASLTAYVIIAAAVAWISVGIFTEAAFYKARLQRLQALLDEVMDDIAGYYEELAIDLEEKETGRG